MTIGSKHESNGMVSLPVKSVQVVSARHVKETSSD